MNAAIVFDLDGTLYDSRGLDVENETAAVMALAEFRGIGVSAARDLMNVSRSTTSGMMSLSRTLFVLGVPDDVFMRHQLLMLHPEKYISRDCRLVELIRLIGERYKTALYTNTRRQVVHRILVSIGLSYEDFDLVVAGGDTDEPKPSIPELRKLAQKLDVEPAHCYVLGDRWTVDLEPAVSLGMTPVMIESRDSLIRWLEAHS